MENVSLVHFDQFKQFAKEVIAEELKQFWGQNPNSTNNDQDKLYSRKELAEFLGLSTATITTYKNDGMPFLRVKRRPYFKIKEVEKYMTKMMKK